MRIRFERKEADASDVAELVDAAYGHYVERIGMVPGPMTLDYAEVVRTAAGDGHRRDGSIVGLLVLNVTDEGFVVENVAVHPSELQRGLGRGLALAEAEERRAGSRRSRSTRTR